MLSARKVDLWQAKSQVHIPISKDRIRGTHAFILISDTSFYHLQKATYHLREAHKKILRNVERDQQNISKLETMGWRVITVWECELKKKVFDSTLTYVVREILTPK